MYLDSRIRLRGVNQSDTKFLEQWISSPELTRHTLGRRFPVQDDAIEDWIAVSNRGQFPTRIVFVIETNLPVGMVQLDDIDWVSQNAWLGIWLVPEVRGKKIGPSAVTEILEYARLSLNLRQVRLLVRSDNLTALNLYQQLGFRHEGKLTDADFRDGQLLNLEMMRIDLK